MLLRICALVATATEFSRPAASKFLGRRAFVLSASRNQTLPFSCAPQSRRLLRLRSPVLSCVIAYCLPRFRICALSRSRAPSLPHICMPSPSFSNTVELSSFRLLVPSRCNTSVFLNICGFVDLRSLHPHRNRTSQSFHSPARQKPGDILSKLSNHSRQKQS